MVNIVYEETNKKIVTPIVNERILTTNINYINKVLGIDISINFKYIIAPKNTCLLLEIMGIKSVDHENGNIDC